MIDVLRNYNNSTAHKVLLDFKMATSMKYDVLLTSLMSGLLVMKLAIAATLSVLIVST